MGRLKGTKLCGNFLEARNCCALATIGLQQRPSRHVPNGVPRLPNIPGGNARRPVAPSLPTLALTTLGPPEPPCSRSCQSKGKAAAAEGQLGDASCYGYDRVNVTRCRPVCSRRGGGVLSKPSWISPAPKLSDNNGPYRRPPARHPAERWRDLHRPQRLRVRCADGWRKPSASPMTTASAL
jgi:hypothetical protein